MQPHQHSLCCGREGKGKYPSVSPLIIDGSPLILASHVVEEIHLDSGGLLQGKGMKVLLPGQDLCNFHPPIGMSALLWGAIVRIALYVLFVEGEQVYANSV